VTGDERRETLADQAAAWVPPWERPDIEPQADDSQSHVEVEGSDTEPESRAEAGEHASLADEPVVSAGEPASPAGAEAEIVEPAVAAEPAAGAGPVVDAEPTQSLAEAEPGVDEPSAGGEADAAPQVPAGVPTEADVPTDAVEPADVVADFDEATDAAAPAADVEPAAEEQSALALIDDAELKAALEAILLVVDEPVTEIVLAQILEQPTERVAATLVTIAEGYTAAGHGFDLRKVAGGWRLYTRPEYAPYVERFVLDGQSVRLTQAALETLAVIAYKQPVTRSRISAIRGVNCDGVIRTLVSRGLVEECGTEPESGAFLYRTTTLFLEKLGMNSVNDLPPLAPFLPDDVEEIADAAH
jgi:segregation and condensation protein B